MKVKENSLKGIKFASSILTICLGLLSINQVKADPEPNGYEEVQEVTCSDGSDGYMCRWNTIAYCDISGQNCGC